jgi:hypothetical protein
MDNSSIIDELFARIQSLEDENKNLKGKISEFELELVKKEGDDKDLSDNEKEESKKDVMMIDDTFEEIKPVKPVTITYIPNEDLRKLYIMGDFTNWEPTEMVKELSNVYTYNVPLLIGYKYFYCFFTDDQPIVDFANLFEENPSNGQIHNVIYLANNENKFEDYDFNKNKKLWENSKKSYFKKQIGEEAEVQLIEDCINKAETFKRKTEKILNKKNDKINRIKKSYE